MRRQLLPALLMIVVMTVLLGGAYPAVVWGIGQLGWRHQASGSLVEHDGQVVGSALIGQRFTGAEWFHPRPSAAGDGYDPRASSGSNLGPNNETFLDEVSTRVTAYRSENGLGPHVAVPVDAVTASASGLDPHISVANARLQAPRVAEARAMPLDDVMAAVDAAIEHRPLGILGDDGVNVLLLNLALDGAPAAGTD